MAIALSPDEQKRLIVRPPTLTGSPARIAATRAMLCPCVPCGWPQPRVTSSTSFLLSCGTLPSASVLQWAAGPAGGEREAAAVDPRHADVERLGADEVRMLRLAAVQGPAGVGLGVREQNPEECAVALVAARALGGAHDVEASPEIRGREQIVVDVRDDREPRTWAEPSECVVHVGKPSKARKRLEVVLDEIGIA